jgi:hypothetical protein
MAIAGKIIVVQWPIARKFNSKITVKMPSFSNTRATLKYFRIYAFASLHLESQHVFDLFESDLAYAVFWMRIISKLSDETQIPEANFSKIYIL